MSISKRLENSTTRLAKTEEDEILTKKLPDSILILNKSKNISITNSYGISSDELEELVSFYTEGNNKNGLMKNMERLGGTKGIMEKLKTSVEIGIESPDSRVEEFGTNKIFEEPPSPFIKFLKESLSELMIIILLSAAVIQIIIGLTISDNKKTGWLDGASVLFAVFVVVTVESFTNWQKEKKFYDLNNLKK